MSRLGKAAVVVSGGILLSRVLGFLRDVAITAVLGSGPGADVYVAAFFVPDLLFYLMAGGYLSITFIPILARYLAEEDERGGWEAFSAVAKPLVAAMTAITVVAIAAAGWLVEVVFVRFPGALPGAPTPALDAGQIEQVVELTRIVMPAQVFFMLGSLLMAVQYAHQRFVVPSVAPIVYNLFIIAGGLLQAGLYEAGPAGFVWGALSGALVGNLALQWWGARRTGLQWVGGTSVSHPAVREYAGLAVPLMLGQSVAVLDEQFIRVFGNLAGDGAIAQLRYARGLNMLPVGVIAQAAGVAAYPFLARLVAEGKIAEMRRTVTKALRYAIYVSGLASAAVVGASQPAVRVAFQRGAFEPSDTVATAAALAVFGLTIPLWAAHQVYARGFYAHRDMWRPVIIGTVWTLLGIPIYTASIERFGLRGVPVASLVSMGGYTLSMAFIWYRRTDGGELREVAAAVVRTAAASIPAGLAIWWTAGWVGGAVTEMGLLRGLVALAAAGTAGTGVFAVVSRLLRSPELAELRSARASST